jgi:hypothetical protein
MWTLAFVLTVPDCIDYDRVCRFTPLVWHDRVVPVWEPEQFPVISYVARQNSNVVGTSEPAIESVSRRLIVTVRLGRLGGEKSRNDTQNSQQYLPFFNQPTTTSVSVRTLVKNHDERYLQDILWEESLLAVKESLSCRTVEELSLHLQEKLPQNSAVTRRRNAGTILGRFFPTDGLDQLPRQVLQIYNDEALLAAVMRVLFLETEPLVGKLIAERLFKLPAGSILPRNFFTQYAQEAFGKKDAHVSSRCCTAARVLGWTIVERKKYYVAQQNPDETAAMLIFHYRFAG